MAEIIHNKLVRDKIISIILEEGYQVETHKISDNKQYIELLNNKLNEEVKEYNESHDPMELIDIMEVIFAIAENIGISIKTLEEMRITKLDSKGGFKDRVFLKKVIAKTAP